MKIPSDAEVPHRGCLNACVATILSFPVSRVPRFDCMDSMDDQLRALKYFLRNLGYFVIVLDADHEESIPMPHIAIGPNGTGNHAMVCNGDEIVYNFDGAIPDRIEERWLIVDSHSFSGV